MKTSMDKQHRIPKSFFAADDEEARLKQKREELKRKLLEGRSDLIMTKGFIFLPQEIENARLSGILYGHKENIMYYVTSNQDKKENEIGRIFETKPKQNLSEGITGYYENSVLKFENPDGSECGKISYRLFEKWMKGEVDLIYNPPKGIEIPPCKGFIPGL